MLQNSGKEQMIDLMEARISVAESTLSNLITDGLYSDGTGSGGKEIDGLSAALPLDPTLTPYGGIDGSAFSFWRNAVSDNTAAAVTPTTIQGLMNDLWAQLVRGADRPDLIMADNVFWTTYVDSLQSLQRFTNTNSADAGFMNVMYMDAEVCLDGGIYQPAGGGADLGTSYWLNCDYIHYRPHADRNMVSLSPNRRYATNQDAEVNYKIAA